MTIKQLAKAQIKKSGHSASKELDENLQRTETIHYIDETIRSFRDMIFAADEKDIAKFEAAILNLRINSTCLEMVMGLNVDKLIKEIKED